jgi:tRNA(Ile)-lysidine synthetase-like protein
MNASLQSAIDSVPAGKWAVGVSGGADSVSLLTLLRARGDLSLHVVHLNHQTRGGQSDGDARFVGELAGRLGLPFTVSDRSTMESGLTDLPRNPSARYRRLRIALFRRTALENRLNGVLLAHHVDDQAETILHRVLRGSGYSGLAGMSSSTVIGGLRVLRPLLGLSREQLRQWLRDNDQLWREDPSNRSPQYLRNRLRMLLADDPTLRDALIELGLACAAVGKWVKSSTPQSNGPMPLKTIGDLPQILARAAARNWLIASGVEAGKIEPATIDRFLVMCVDASTPLRQQFPGGVFLARHRGVIEKVI